MSQVAVDKCKDPETGLNALLENIESITDSIRQRAFDIFQPRGGGLAPISTTGCTRSVNRHLDLPPSVNVDKVTASVDKGILEITAPRASARQLTVAA
jgi:hypothetical protein